MKKVIRLAACLALLGTTVVGCQKEDFGDTHLAIEENASVYVVSYSIDGVNHSVTLVGDAAWTDFLNWMFALSEEGHNVSFRLNTNSQVISAKEEITYTTSDHDDAYSWADQKAKEGYTVFVSFDDKTGIYTCLAVR